jgi:predicted HTH domain antitoxin
MTKNKQIAVNMIMNKLNNHSFMTYKEIAEMTNYHPKYILKLKKEVENDNIKIQHGNKNRASFRKISEEEKKQIINLYKRSSVSIRKFSKFYSKRSYSCIYYVLKESGLLK